jgi:alkylhydroperoxidase family enzyme
LEDWEQKVTRVAGVYKQSDYPGAPDEAVRQDLAALFNYLFPEAPESRIDRSHAGLAVAALNPNLAMTLAKVTRFIAGELPWCDRLDLRELAIQAVNLHFRCDYSYAARIPAAEAAGIGAALLRALPAWKTSALFDDERRLVVEYATAVAAGEVSDELFVRVVNAFGEKGAVEFTALAAFWSFWALFLKATI